MRKTMRKKSIPILCLALCLLLSLGCGKGAKKDLLLESEKKLKGMYEACQEIEIIDASKRKGKISLAEVKRLPQLEVNAVLKRANGMTMPGRWAGPTLASVFSHCGVRNQFKEVRIEAWDGYIARVSADIAMRPDTILAYEENGKLLPREVGPLRLVVASQDGFYWIHSITKMEIAD
ncbi:MAG: molybdopterin-dependent oxidoreductase [Actinomycetota bacterium]|nr:molybdopterin-dependent oxidoreductase [Actinomycetota bacterium]